MDVQKCKICGERHHRYEPHRFPAAPEVPRSNARSPNRGTRGKSTRQSTDDPAALSSLPGGVPDTPDTAPSFTDLARSLTDDELRPFYNEWMRRKMLAKRARKPAPAGSSDTEP